MLREQINAVKKNDPAARSTLEILFCYPGVKAVIAHQISHWLWYNNSKLLARMHSQFWRSRTGIEIHPGAIVDKSVFIDHGMGVVIGETAVVGKNVVIYHGVTLGGSGKSSPNGKRHPTIGHDVVLGAGCTILGDILINDYVTVGANATVTKSIYNGTVIGCSARNKTVHYTGELIINHF